MLPLAHLGFTLLALEVVGRRVRVLLGLSTLGVLIGALLPDLVDKPLAFFVIRNNNTHLVGHTLAFVGMLAVTAWVLRARAPGAALVASALATGSLAHLLIDGMWAEPRTLFWPVLGADFPPLERGLDRYLWDYLRAWREWLPWEAAGALALTIALALRRARERGPANAPGQGEA